MEGHREEYENFMRENENLVNRCIRRSLRSVTQKNSWKLVNEPGGITTEELLTLSRGIRSLFLSQPMLLELEGPITVCGDIHGQFDDLLNVFYMCGLPGTEKPAKNGKPSRRARYLFLGDYVDRGYRNLEVVALLFAFRLKHPDDFFLLRGNHESYLLNMSFGFLDECKERIREDKKRRVFLELNVTFNHLPISAIIGKRIFCAHGGFSPDLYDLDQIRSIRRPQALRPSGVMADILWSDPCRFSNPNAEFFTRYWGVNKRGTAVAYGQKAVDLFLERFGLDLVVRAHECILDGYLFEHNMKVLTIFSASYYQELRSDLGQYHTNRGAVLEVSADLSCNIKTFIPFWLTSDRDDISPDLERFAGYKHASICISELKEYDNYKDVFSENPLYWTLRYFEEDEEMGDDQEEEGREDKGFFED
ncbi:hypothetical protein L596_009640 [Steinernema carpocapsae]|uniref:Serine/threonine-protein phosphatase n=1 Tax=Steinernema carpocapsae TaxID=34508 RepID=A0A4U5PH89_STECR|nr:hypothetical protein L596_009640 [Steinernema carpocapsae]